MPQLINTERERLLIAARIGISGLGARADWSRRIRRERAFTILYSTVQQNRPFSTVQYNAGEVQQCTAVLRALEEHRTERATNARADRTHAEEERRDAMRRDAADDNEVLICCRVCCVFARSRLIYTYRFEYLLCCIYRHIICSVFTDVTILTVFVAPAVRIFWVCGCLQIRGTTYSTVSLSLYESIEYITRVTLS